MKLSKQIQTVIQTSFANITVTAYNSDEAVELNSLYDLPKHVFRLTNTFGDIVSVSVNVENLTQIPNLYNPDQLVDALYGALREVHSMVDDDFAEQINALHPLDEAARYKEIQNRQFKYLAARNTNNARTFRGFSATAPEPEKQETDYNLDIIRSIIDTSIMRWTPFEGIHIFHRNGWTVDNTHARLFMPTKSGLAMTFLLDNDQEKTDQVALNGKIAGTFGGMKGVLMLNFPASAYFGSGPVVNNHAIYKLTDKFWPSLIEDIKGGIDNFNNSLATPDFLRVAPEFDMSIVDAKWQDEEQRIIELSDLYDALNARFSHF